MGQIIYLDLNISLFYYMNSITTHDCSTCHLTLTSVVDAGRVEILTSVMNLL